MVSWRLDGGGIQTRSDEGARTKGAREVDWDIKMARDLMIEFVGGEPAAQIRDQFAA
jgi:hypothetical protein